MLRLSNFLGTSYVGVSGYSGYSGINGTGSGSNADFSAVMEDIVPAISSVYDIGTPENKWYNGYFYNALSLNNVNISTDDSDKILIIDAEDILTNANFTLKSALFDDLFITHNVIKPLSTPLYGQREAIVEGGLSIASLDPAFIKLNQVIPTVTTEVNVQEEWTFPDYPPDENASIISLTALGSPDTVLYYRPATLITSGNFNNIAIGQEYDILALDVNGNVFFQETRKILSIGDRGPELGAPANYFNFITIESKPGDAANYPPSNPTIVYFSLSRSGTLTQTDYSVLDNYGSAGMIRFNPQTNKFQGHDGNDWFIIEEKQEYITYNESLGNFVLNNPTLESPVIISKAVKPKPILRELNSSNYVNIILDNKTSSEQLSPSLIDVVNTGNYSTIFVYLADSTNSSYPIESGASVTIRFYSGVSASLSFSSNDWRWLGTKPSSLTPDKYGILTLTAFGTTQSDIIAVWAEEE